MKELISPWANRVKIFLLAKFYFAIQQSLICEDYLPIQHLDTTGMFQL